jgi:hypothetical protein
MKTRYPQLHAVKLLSDSLEHLRPDGKGVYIKDTRVFYVEMAGVCIERSDRFIRVLDFCGEVPMTKGVETEIAEAPCLFMCVPYTKDSTVRLFCKASRRIGIFEEMFFWAEAIGYRRECIGLE